MRKVKLTRILPRLRLKGWLTLAIPLALALSFLISTGGDLQHGIVSALRSDAPSLYAGAYQEGIARFPGLGTWLSWGFDPLFLTVCLLVVTAALHARTVFGVALGIALGMFLALTALDLSIYMLAGDTKLAGGLGVSIASNLTAGIALGLASVLLLKGFLSLWRKSLSGSPVVYLFPPLTVAAAAAVSTILYLILFFFFHPTVVTLQARVEAPARGFFMAGHRGAERLQTSFGSDDEEANRSFSMIPPRTPAGSAELTAIESRPSIAWEGESGSRFKADVTVVTNCGAYDAFKRTKGFPPTWSMSHISSLKLDVGHGLTHILFDDAAERNYTTNMRRGALFWIKENKDTPSKGVSFEAFVDPKDEFVVEGDVPLRMFVDTMLLDVDDKKRASGATRVLRLTADGKPLEIRAGGPLRFKDRNIACEPVSLPPDGTMTAQAKEQLSNALHAGVLITINQIREDTNLLSSDFGKVSVAGLSGPVEVFRPKLRELLNRHLGRTGAIAIGGNITRAMIDGTEVQIGEHDTFQGHGRFDGSLEERGYEISGSAEGLWRNQRRVNPTRWERMPTEIQATLLGVLGLGLLALGRLFMSIYPHLKKDEELFLHL